MRIITRDDGTNRRVRLGLRYASGSGPETLFLKANQSAHRELHLRNGNLFNEARLFAAGVPLDVDHPIVYKSIVDTVGMDFLLVMEDINLRGADPRDSTRPMTIEQVANGLRGLARLAQPVLGLLEGESRRAGLGADLGAYGGLAGGTEEVHSHRAEARCGKAA